jgi:hypothetical protein
MAIQTYELKEIVKTYKLDKAKGEIAKDLAIYFGAMLAVDKGIQSEVRKISEDEYITIADDGKGVKFTY